MELILKKIDNEEIDPLHSILKNCGQVMHENLGLDHWYPFMDINAFKSLLQKKDLYGVYQNGIAVSTFNLSTEPRDYYYDELWSNPQEKAIYLGQLGVDPRIQSKGIGKWCMNQIEIISRNLLYKAIRFDALDTHPWLKIYYEKLGYTSRGIVKSKQWNLLCFEKILF